MNGCIIQKADFMGLKEYESTRLLNEAADAIEELQQYADLYKDLTEKSQKVATELKQQLQKSEEDNVNLTGWLAEEHAKHLWIPVTERLPEENGHYLVHAVGNGYCSTYIALWNGRFRANFEMPVKYWMPLPKPPKDGES